MHDYVIASRGPRNKAGDTKAAEELDPRPHKQVVFNLMLRTELCKVSQALPDVSGGQLPGGTPVKEDRQVANSRREEQRRPLQETKKL